MLDAAVLDAAMVQGAAMLDAAVLDAAVLDAAVLDAAVLPDAVLDAAVLDAAVLPDAGNPVSLLQPCTMAARPAVPATWCKAKCDRSKRPFCNEFNALTCCSAARCMMHRTHFSNAFNGLTHAIGCMMDCVRAAIDDENAMKSMG
ncbi:hypothetical protein [Mesorhizobium sp. B2-1-2]|uniref:hypothetical protein n=1 Tax=Mesorhizobium sp. B2-1-2 TaxID=2589973 RepID=UPI001746A1FD|nr:hypothetical protein [Mesorhizobium sp. B2-1-2]